MPRFPSASAVYSPGFHIRRKASPDAFDNPAPMRNLLARFSAGEAGDDPGVVGEGPTRLPPRGRSLAVLKFGFFMVR
jgi:hypothetical protein